MTVALPEFVRESPWQFHERVASGASSGRDESGYHGIRRFLYLSISVSRSAGSKDSPGGVAISKEIKTRTGNPGAGLG
jgi:hypothetical protein